MAEETTKKTRKHQRSNHQDEKHQPEQLVSVIPQIEVVNEIQIVVHKKDNPQSLTGMATTPGNDNNKDVKKCMSSRSSKTDLTAITTPTTVALDSTAKNVTLNVNKSEKRRSSSKDKEKSESGSTICACGKLLKRVKELLEAKETKTKSK